MAPASARYDEFADWYAQWVGDGRGLIAEHPKLLPAVRDTRILDVACGQARLSRHLVELGATVVGLDVSAAMLAKARAVPTPGLDLVHADVAGSLTWWDGKPFDGCTCDLALMDIDDITGTFRSIATVLRPGGWFVASVVHPCFPGNASGLSSWPPDGGYDTEGWWTSPGHNPAGARIRVGSSHRKLSTYLNALLDAGMQLEHTLEPAAPVPTFLLWRCRKA